MLLHSSAPLQNIFCKSAVDMLTIKPLQDIRNSIFCIMGHLKVIAVFLIMVNRHSRCFQSLLIFAEKKKKNLPPTFWFVTISFPNSDSHLRAFPFLYSKTQYYFAECAFEKPDVHFPDGLSGVVVPANLLPLADTEIISEYSPILTSPAKEGIVNNTFTRSRSRTSY